jgi:hypothetical protein
MLKSHCQRITPHFLGSSWRLPWRWRPGSDLKALKHWRFIPGLNALGFHG